MRTLVVSHYYAPELGAPQTRLGETTRLLAAGGHDVRVLTGPPHYPDGRVRPGYRWWAARHETIDGVPVTRLPMLPRPNRGFVDRVVDQGSFALAAAAAVRQARWADVLLIESPPLFLGLTAAWLGWTAQRPYVYHVADPWPDFPIAMGALRSGLVRRAAYAIEATAYRHAALVTTVTPSLVEMLDAKPAARGRVRLLPNGVDTARFRPELDATTARGRLGWAPATLHLVYLGSVGLVHGVGTLLTAVAPLAPEGVIVHIIGEGTEYENLRVRAGNEGLEHIQFEATRPGEQVPLTLAAADGIVVTLRSGWPYEQTLPTKLLEGLAAGRPILLSGGGDAARIVAGGSGGSAGYVCPAEDAPALRQAIHDLAALDPARRAGIGAAGRRTAEAEFDRRAIVDRLAGYLDEAAGRGTDH